MLIDDSEIDVLVNRRLMQLTDFAFNIVVTETAEQALRYLKEECGNAIQVPDWIFLDMYLPMMNGYDFIEEFKLLPDFIQQKTKIIVLSVMQNPEHLKKVFANNFVAGQFEKPLTQQALKEIASGRFEKIR